MKRARGWFVRSLSLAALAGATFATACSSSDSNNVAVADAGADVDAAPPSDAASTVDANEAAAPVCDEGRRRCVGQDLQVCDTNAWVVLQSCLPGEWCDVAVGIFRPVDAGADGS
jgi:hypothetical protein